MDGYANKMLSSPVTSKICFVMETYFPEMLMFPQFEKWILQIFVRNAGICSELLIDEL